MAVAIIIGIQFSAANKLRENMISERKEQAINLVETLSTQASAMAKQFNVSERERQAQVKQLVNTARYADSGYFFLFDTQGDMVAHAIKPQLNGLSMTNHKQAFISFAFRSFVDKVNEKGAGFVEYAWPKPNSKEVSNKVSYIKQLPDWGWVIGTGIYSADIEEAYQQELMFIAFELLIYIILLMVVSGIVAKNISKPLNKLTRTMSMVASQKDLTIELKHRGDDELSAMAVAFNASNAQFRQVIDNINVNTLSLASHAEELSAVTQQIQLGLAQQNRETESVQDKVLDLKESANNVFDQSQNALKLIDNASGLTEQGKQHIIDNAHQIEQVAQRVESASMSVKKLEESSAQIGEVLDVIQKVAEQTNLLALNAAIEAARAGEQGRGFAVVADEVRTLAIRTHESTEDIQSIIEQLHAGVSETVGEMEKCKDSTEKGLTTSKQCDQILVEIDNAVKQIQSFGQGVASSAKVQSDAMNSIADNISGIVTVSQQTEAGAKHTNSSSRQLSEMSQQLSDMVGEFEV
ncbi:hypothetical protein N473_15115 [Pseudoalteromonas luteoviolacea CPMOR-1]|uniref:Methyl-accepting chemotaxis protein n=1 Tax=Pseudoalteromonas luteoviolacea CPMOR-1 TaxID=1365248 RepID=A0A167LC31_9GAMM|nr:methyl-accepting chemotaxis protein [Pseudoalteromonas luteoviolacea]KZN64276.1 hypothetical protein N473_15115 [Pseudoalteromonas luteoviolacea CPMOR-1]